MKVQYSIFATISFWFIFAFLSTPASAQSTTVLAKYYPTKNAPNGQLQLRSTISKYTRVFLISGGQVTDVTGSISPASTSTVLVIDLGAPLSCVLKTKQGSSASSCTATPTSGSSLALEDHNLLISYVNSTGKALSKMVGIILFQETATLDNLEEIKADSDEDAEYYVSGNITGTHRKKTAFTAEIKLQPYQRRYKKFIFSPFYFNLNASTSADADPDSMEIGFKTRGVFSEFAGFKGAFLDNNGKIESERDFDNTNLIADTRLTFLPPALNKEKFQAYLNPFFGTEMGKNLRSPLNAAEGDGIARVLAGADLRLVFFSKDVPWANWTNSYTRRWLLSNELGFKTDGNNDLILVQFGKRPRDYFESKFSFAVGKFTDAFIAYDWGSVPPSYKKVDHRFRIGFEFKKKTVIK